MPIIELLLNPFAGYSGMNLVSITFYMVIIGLIVYGIWERKYG